MLGWRSQPLASFSPRSWVRSGLPRAEGHSTVDEPPAVKAEPKGQAEAAPGKVFHFQVVAAETGQPIPNATVRIWISLRDEWKTTDDQGRLDIPHSTGTADKSLSVDVWGDGFAMQRHFWGNKPGETVPEKAVVKLERGETLGGLVQDEQGRPIEGATVYMWSHNFERKDPHELLFDLRAVTGPDGRWKTAGAPATTGDLLGFHINHPDYLSDRDYTSKREKPTIAELRAGKAVAVMTKGVPIEGRVLDADGHPVAGATVFSSPRQESLGSDIREFAVTTDEAGHFRTGQVRSEVYYLLATAKGHAPGRAANPGGKSGSRRFEIRLGRPRSFAGKVVDSEGKPIEGAFVNVDTWRKYRFLGVFLYTDREGRFQWNDAPDDLLEINVSMQGYLGLHRQHVEATAKDVTFILKPSLTVSGRVFDAETKKPVERALVEYAVVDPRTREAAAWIALSSAWVSQGHLSVNIQAASDAYKIRIVAEGYEPFVSRVFRRQETAIYDYTINLSPSRPGVAPFATVLRPDGKPLVGARVYRGVRNESNLERP